MATNEIETLLSKGKVSKEKERRERKKEGKRERERNV